MSSFTCPFCNVTMPITDSTHIVRYPSFESSHGVAPTSHGLYINDSCITIEFFKCPQCEKYTIFAKEKGEYTKALNIPLIPFSLAKHLPDYIPQAIRDDYEEAYAIVNLSPKASATLARRCLQGMIRDFHGITKPRLIDEINALQNVVSSAQWKAIDSLRSIGNIGAHMEKNIDTIIEVDPDEAEKLLKLIELLIDKWYIARHDEEKLLLEITNIADDKKNQKQSISTP